MLEACIREGSFKMKIESSRQTSTEIQSISYDKLETVVLHPGIFTFDLQDLLAGASMFHNTIFMSK